MEKLKLIATILLVLANANLQAQDCNDASSSTSPTSRFTDNGDGTVTDRQTELVWQRCPVGFQLDDGSTADLVDDVCMQVDEDQVNWQDALLDAEAEPSGGTTWRVPNVKELLSIVERKCVLPAWNRRIFPAAPLIYWTSTTYNNIRTATVVDFSAGYVRTMDKEDNADAAFTRLVR